MSNLSTEERAARIVAAIVKDFCDRRGLRQSWEEIDDDIRDEIVGAWEQIACRELTR